MSDYSHLKYAIRHIGPDGEEYLINPRMGRFDPYHRDRNGDWSPFTLKGEGVWFYSEQEAKDWINAGMPEPLAPGEPQS